MRTFEVFVHQALEQAHRLAASLSVIRLWPLTVAIVAGLLVSALGPSAPVRAEPPPDPAARLRVDINSIRISNDRDAVGSGEMRLTVKLCPVGDNPDECREGQGITAAYSFSANTGDTLKLDRVVPREGDQALGESSVEGGMPVDAGQRYLFLATIFERDVIGGDDMGKVITSLDSANNWGLGTYFEASDETNQSANGVEYSDFYITYDIRRASLPDLHVRGIRTLQLDDGRQVICAEIENIGERPSGPAPLTLRADGASVKASIVPELGVDQVTQNCTLRTDLPARAHSLGFFIDEQRQLLEMDETNNNALLAVPALVPAAAPGSAPVGAEPGTVPSPQPKPTETASKPSADRADLLVKAIRVNGQPADGKNACKDGKNGVTVAVKNGGKADASSFTVRLSVDGDTLDATVDALPAGEERDVPFENVQLKKGEHALKAVADPGHAISESKDDNNELKISVRCTDAR